MNYALVLRPEVREELNEAYIWYEQKLGLGDEFLDCVDETLNRISQMPESYAVAHRDVRRALVRRFTLCCVLSNCIESGDCHSNFSRS
jgi:hypothetical protein